MKNVQLREWKDLSTEEKKTAKDKMTTCLVEGELDMLSFDLDQKMITEKEFYEQIGCSKHYADTTAWFVPACYYEKHKKDIDSEVKERLASAVYDAYAEPVSLPLRPE